MSQADSSSVAGDIIVSLHIPCVIVCLGKISLSHSIQKNYKIFTFYALGFHSRTFSLKYIYTYIYTNVYIFSYSIFFSVHVHALRCKILKTFFNFANRRLWPTIRRTAFCARFHVKLMRIILEFIKTAYMYIWVYTRIYFHTAGMLQWVQTSMNWSAVGVTIFFFHLQFCVHTQWTGI